MADIWKILGIEPTQDTNTIKMAYRQKLVNVNPEDDPEGFKALREAYEQADREARTPKPEQEAFVKDESPMGLWIEKVRERYGAFSDRMDLSGWKELFAEDLCVGLDTANAAREEFLKFTMDQYRLPHDVWVAADEVFHIMEDMEELKGKFPPNFMGFVESAIRYDSTLDLRLFEGGDYEDYDGAINLYYQYKGALDQENIPGAENFLAQLKEIPVSHPLFEIDEARLLRKKGDMEQALLKARKVCERYPEENYILYYTADITLGNDLVDEAKELFTKLVGLVPNHFYGRAGLAECMYREGSYKEAKELCLELMELDGNNQVVQECLKKNNEKLIEIYSGELEADPENADARMELGWSVFQCQDYDRCIALMEAYEPDEAHLYDYINLTGRVYLCVGRFEKALSYMTRWLTMIEETVDDGSKEAVKRIRRRSYAHYGIACAHMGMLEEGRGGSQEEVITHMEQAIATEQQLNQRLIYTNALAEMELNFEHYEKCVDLCQKVLDVEPQYYMAYLNRQKAFFEMGYDRDVLDDYYRAVEIYPAYAQPYILAAKVFLRHDDAKNALEVAKRAEAAGLSGDALTFVGLRAQRLLAQNKDESETVLNGLSELVKNLNKEETDIEKTEEPLYEIVLCLMDLRRYDEALDRVDEVIRQNSTEDNYFYTKANILMQLRKFDKAEDIYRELDKRRPNNSAILFRLGQVSERRGRRLEAVAYYERVLEVYDKHGQANQCIKDIFQEEYNRSGKREDFEKALKHATAQLAVCEDDYYYIERGLLYLDAVCRYPEYFKEAEQDFVKAAEINPKNPYAFNNLGFTYQRAGRYLEAVEQYKKAFEVLENDPTPLPYINMVKCYRILKKYDLALEAAMKRKERFPGNAAEEVIADIYKDMLQFDKSADCLKELLAKDQKNEQYYMRKIGYVYEDAGDYKQAEAWYQGALKKGPNDANNISKLGRFFMNSKADYKQALKYLEKESVLRENDQDPGDYIQCLCYIGRCWYYLKKTGKSIEAFQKAYNCACKKTGTPDGFIQQPGYESYNRYWMGYIYAHLEQYDKAEECFKHMEADVKCRHCMYAGCEEAYMGQGLMAWLQGDKEKAKEFFEKCLELEPLETECRGYLTALTQQKKKGLFGF